jgi:YesN/AraC family two-component response regulator
MKVNDTAKIKELTKGLVILYVEDEEDIRHQMVGLLRILFKEVHVARDGFEGISLFQKCYYDLIITDIQMPNMNGLDMVQTIRLTHPNIPIIITTAFSDQEYFIRSIDLKIDKYLLKPIEEGRAKQVFADIAWIINDRKKAKEYELQQLQEKINRLSEKIIAQITESYHSPCIIYTNDTVRYFNDSFCSIFDAGELQRFLKGEKGKIPFDKRSGFIASLEEYDSSNPSKNRISVSKRQGRKIYRIVRREIQIDNEEEQSLIYFFNDITLEEYQKIKIRSYNEILEELVIQNRYRGKRVAVLPCSLHQTIAKDYSEENRAKAVIFEEPTKAEFKIDDEENKLLRRAHVNKTTATEYISELDYEILQELQELDELDDDLKELIYQLQEDEDIKGLQQMAIQLERYAHEISMLFEFEDLAYAIRSLAKVLGRIEDSAINTKNMKKIILLLSGIQSDLGDWRRYLFVTQNALDIHYLDSSLFSDCLQIELILSNEPNEIDSSEDDLILF